MKAIRRNHHLHCTALITSCLLQEGKPSVFSLILLHVSRLTQAGQTAVFFPSHRGIPALTYTLLLQKTAAVRHRSALYGSSARLSDAAIFLRAGASVFSRAAGATVMNATSVILLIISEKRMFRLTQSVSILT